MEFYHGFLIPAYGNLEGNTLIGRWIGKELAMDKWKRFLHIYWIIAGFALIKLVMHLLTGNNYGYHGDELYTLACSNHLDFGYVDIPPLVPALLALNTKVIGDSLFAIHILPAIAGSLTVIFGGLMVKQLGGGKFAQGMACLAVLLAPVWLTMNTMFAYDTFDQLFTVIFLYFLLLLLKDQNPKTWIMIGVFAGISLLTKPTMLFFGFALILALLLTPNRKYFKTKWFWYAMSIAGVLFGPYLLWQASHSWPVAEYWGAYSQYKSYHANFTEFLINQILIVKPTLLPLWLMGLWYFLFSKQGKAYRMLGLIYGILFTLFFIINAKAYMIAACYVILFAAGSVVFENFLRNKAVSWVKPVYLAFMIITGMILIPNCLPLLSPETLAQYYKALPFLTTAVKLENYKAIEFPSFFADRFGWDNMVAVIAKVYNSLPEMDREKCSIICNNYSQAGAVDLLGGKYHLPKAISGHLTYYIWGPGAFNGKTAVVVGVKKEALEQLFHTVEPKEIINSQYSSANETNIHVYVCRNLKMAVKDAWPLLKNY